MKFATRPMGEYAPHLRHVATLALLQSAILTCNKVV